MEKLSRYLSLVFILSLVVTGCGSKETVQDTSNNIVIINAGDSSVKNETTSSEKPIIKDNNVETNINSSTVTIEDTKTEVIEDVTPVADDKAMYGSWTTIQGVTFNLLENNQLVVYDRTYTESGSGTYETDWETYLNVKYSFRVSIENPTEVQVLMNDIYKDEVFEIDYKITEIDKTTNNELVTVKATYDSMYETFIVAKYNLKDMSENIGVVVESQELTADEQIKYEQSLIDKGIDPLTGLPIENIEKLKELGIDPVTGLPIETPQPQ